MTEATHMTTGAIELFPSAAGPSPVTDELNRILGILRNVCPPDATISFDFDGQLHVHIDVRKREEVTVLEAVLPPLGMGLFHSLRRSATPHRPFSHRVSALVAS